MSTCYLLGWHSHADMSQFTLKPTTFWYISPRKWRSSYEWYEVYCIHFVSRRFVRSYGKNSERTLTRKYDEEHVDSLIYSVLPMYSVVNILIFLVSLIFLRGSHLFPIFIMPSRSKNGRGECFCPVCHSLFNLAKNFWTMSARALIFHFYPVTLTLEIDSFSNFNHLMSARALIFHMSILCDKTYPWIPLFFTLWPWPWSLTHFFENFNIANKFWTVSGSLRAFKLHISISCDKIFLLVSRYLSFFGIGHYRGHLCFSNTSCLLGHTYSIFGGKLIQNTKLKQ